MATCSCQCIDFFCKKKLENDNDEGWQDLVLKKKKLSSADLPFSTNVAFYKSGKFTICACTQNDLCL